MMAGSRMGRGGENYLACWGTKSSRHLENAGRHEGKAGNNKLLEGYPLTTMLCKSNKEFLKG